MAQLVRLNNGFVSVSTNAPGADCYDVAGPNPDDQEPFGEVPLMQCLGVSSLPYPPDDTGYAEGVMLEGVGGLPGVIVAAWDTRTFSLFGSLEAGDTVLHSTGPNKAAQVICKEKKKQVVLASKGTDGKQILVIVDGKNDSVQITGFGMMFQMSPDGIVLETGGCGISLHPQHGIQLRGAVQIGGMVVPPGMSMAVAAIPQWAALSALAGGPITPIPNALGAV